MIKGIDVSEFQSNIDWIKVAASGIKFAIIRAGYGSLASQVDGKFASHIKGATDAGLKVGVYWFGYAYTVEGAKKEAETCAAVLKPYKKLITLPVFYDWEYDSDRYAKSHGVSPTATLVTNMTIAFMDKIAASGYKTGYYTNQDYLNNKYVKSRLKAYDLWMAYYSSDEYKDCAIQQYTSTGTVLGIGGHVDMCKMYKDYTNTSADTKKEVKEKTIKVSAKQLRKGSTGSRVRTLQTLLNLKANAGLTVDGDFGEATEKAVIAFQKAKSVPLKNGVVGKYTWEKLLK